MFRPLMTLAGAASLTLCATVSASALPTAAEQSSYVVNFQTEQLLTEHGVNELRQALRASARHVCQPNYARTLQERRQVALCAEEAYAQALQQLEIKVAQARLSGRQYASNTAAAAQDAGS